MSNGVSRRKPTYASVTPTADQWAAGLRGTVDAGPGACRPGAADRVARKACPHQIEPEIAEQAERFEAMTVIEWASRLRCSVCAGRDPDFVVTGEAR